MGKKEYGKTKECLKQVQNMIMNNPGIFDIDEQVMAKLLIEVMNEFKGKEIITIDDMKALRVKYKERIKELFGNNKAIGHMEMLVDSFIMPALCDSQDSVSEIKS